MIQLTFPLFTKYLERTLPNREISSVDLPRPFVPNGSSQLYLPFPKRNHRRRVNRRSGNRHKRALFKGKSTIDCVYCEQPVTYNQATVEHIIPTAEGGINLRSNIAIACGPCNHNRQNIPFHTWKKIVMSRGNRGYRKQKIYPNTYAMMYDVLKFKGRLLERKYLK